MSDFLIYGSKQESIGVRVVTWKESGAPSFVQARVDEGKLFYLGDDRRAAVDQIILHHDGMKSARGCFRVLVERGLSTHLIIDWDGTVYQPLDLALVAFHAAGRNASSIGLDLNNPIRPDRLPKSQKVQSRGIYTGEFNGSRVSSLGYTDQQYHALIAVLRGLGRIFPPLANLTAPVGDDGQVRRNKLQNPGFVGLVGHLHVSATKWDPGPGFDWDRVLIGVRGTRLVYPVTLPDAQNLDRVPRAKALRNAETYFRAIEMGKGGFFPLGVNQSWHTGVHFEVKPGTEVRAPADGVIVATRISEEVEGLGSPNVVVIKHELPIAEQDVTFFSVISHLQQVEIGRNSAIDWIRRFALDPKGPRELPENDAVRHPPAAPGHIALYNDRVALAEVEVKAGDLIGYSGRFAVEPGAEPVGVLDFAIIAPRPLFPKSEITFEPVDDDDDDDILCNSRKVWKQFTEDPEALRGLVEGGFPMSAAEIRAVFRTPRKAVSMRWMAARHVTEYNTRTRFGGLFGGGVDFEWYVEDEARRYMDRIRKFLWWDEAVTEHAELPADGLVWAYHPIALATYLAVVEGARAVEKGGAKAEALDGAELRKARQADQQLEARFAEQVGASGDHIKYQAVDDIVDGEDLYEQSTDDPEREGWLRWEQGEWEPELD